MGEPGPTVYTRARVCVCVNARPRPCALPRELNRQLGVGAFIERLLLARLHREYANVIVADGYNAVKTDVISWKRRPITGSKPFETRHFNDPRMKEGCIFQMKSSD